MPTGFSQDRLGRTGGLPSDLELGLAEGLDHPSRKALPGKATESRPKIVVTGGRRWWGLPVAGCWRIWLG